MALFILLALIGLLLLEIAVFIEVGEVLGVGLTIGMTVLTAITGVFLMRAQGLSTLIKVRGALDRGDIPVRAVFDGACQLIAGGLLLIPGFLTDFTGLLLFIPFVRLILFNRLIASAAITVVGSREFADEDSARHPYDVESEYKDVTPTGRQALGQPKEDDRQG